MPEVVHNKTELLKTTAFSKHRCMETLRLFAGRFLNGATFDFTVKAVLT